MPSNHGDGMRIMVRKDVLTKEDWVRLIEARAALIQPFLNKLTLKTFGDTPYDGKKGLELNRFLIGSFSAEVASKECFGIQGFFAPVYGRTLWMARYHRSFYWGISRRAKFLFFYVKFGNRSGRYVDKIVVREVVDAGALIKRTKIKPEDIWSQMGEFFDSALKERKELCDEMESIQQIMIAERAVLSLLPKG